MDLEEPVVVYVAATNVEAHQVVEILRVSGIPAMAVEDKSGASLWSFGIISQFHKPKIWVEKAMAERAAEVVRDFEERRRQRMHPAAGDDEIAVECEECGRTTAFPIALFGSAQECSHCHSFVDVGEPDWDEQFEEEDEEELDETS